MNNTSREIKFRAWDKKVEQILKPSTVDDFSLNALRADRYDLMQYTGLKDKNGIEIYEGDIVTWHNKYFDMNNPKRENTGQVKFDNGHFSIYTLAGDWDNSDWVGAIYDLEVIGNIYENPELIEALPSVGGSDE